MARLGTVRKQGTWLLTSLVVHGLGLLVVVWLWWPAPAPERAPIRVTLFRPEVPVDEARPAPQLLYFRKATHPHVRETLEIPQRVLALAPPPLDAILATQARAGGPALQLEAKSSSIRFRLGGAGGGLSGTGFGPGNGAASEGASFQEYVGGLRQAGLDVVFVIDATGSMGWLIEEVKDRVLSLAAWVRRLVPVTRFGVVAYRDDDDPEFLVRVRPLTLSIGKVQRFLDQLEARGGGDIPEGVDAGLRAAIEQVGWRQDSKRVIVILGDAPPHPEQLESSLALARDFAAHGGTVTTVDVSFDANPTIAAARLGKRVEDLQTLSRRGAMPEFLSLAQAGGGDGATLEGDRSIVRQLALLIFGRRWSEAVRPLLETL